MSWFTNLEKNIAGKLYTIFSDASELADNAVNDIARAEVALEAAKQRAAEATKAAHEAAQAALEKAQAETQALVVAAEEAAKKAAFHAIETVLDPSSVEQKVEADPKQKSKK